MSSVGGRKGGCCCNVGGVRNQLESIGSDHTTMLPFCSVHNIQTDITIIKTAALNTGYLLIPVHHLTTQYSAREVDQDIFTEENIEYPPSY